MVKIGRILYRNNVLYKSAKLGGKMEKILLIEDDRGISRILQLELQHQGYSVDPAYTGVEGLKKSRESFYNLILLDLMLPEMSGEEVCKKIRETSAVPIVVVTAKDKIFSKVNLLDIGADDYITKPFEMEELYARMRVALRNKKDHKNEECISYDNIKLNQKTAQVFKGDIEIEVTKKEFQLLEYLLLNKEIVITREQILNNVWGYDYDGVEKIVDVYIKAIREKVDVEKEVIQAVRGVGYVIRKKAKAF